MNPICEALTPRSDAQQIDWPTIESCFDWFQELGECPQDPAHHGEGDVLIHTKMVCEALVGFREWQALSERDRRITFWAALLHDVAKPATTRTDADGRIIAPGHSRRGQIRARDILWHLGWTFQERETLCHLITHHLVPFHLINNALPERRVHLISHQTRCDLLVLLSRADATGRVTADRKRLLDNIDLFAEICREEACFNAPRCFPSDQARFEYFRKPDRSPDYAAYDNTRSVVTLLSGLPASGKDWWLQNNPTDQTVISLDALRNELGVAADRKQGAVIARAKELAKAELRKGRPLIWNATNISRGLRGSLIDLFAAYDARIKIRYFETTPAEQERRNLARTNPVPYGAIERMIARWEPPDLTECQELEISATS